MNDKICWMTDEGCEWLTEEVEELTVEVALDYVRRTEELAEQLILGWWKNGEQVDLTVYFEIGSLLKHERMKREQQLNAALSEVGF